MSGHPTTSADSASLGRDHVVRELGASAIRLCSIPETCALLGVSRWQIYQLINRRELKTVKIGRRRLVPLLELHDFIDRRRRTSGVGL